MDQARLDELLGQGFRKPAAIAWLRSEGRCEYCSVDLIGTRQNWSMQQFDHLLPRGKYPDFVEDRRNMVNSCLSCNSMKGDADVLQSAEDAEDMLENHRHQLIRRARKYISARNEVHDRAWAKARDTILGRPNSA
ncbi:MAG: HNH endonuclease [Gammaproteobacteria bacterium]|nr:HNH endonuclease [Gammaproteobacteria bacterium]